MSRTVIRLTGEPFPVGLGEPPGELPQIVANRLLGILGEIVAVQVFPHQEWFVDSDEQTIENVMVTVLTALWTDSRRTLHSFSPQLTA